MNVAYPDPSTALAFEFKINRQADIYFTLLQDGVAIASVTGWTWALAIKRYPGSRTNIINLTLGNGLNYDTYSDIVLHAHLTSAQANIDEGEYFIQLIRTDIEKTWIEGPCFFRFAKNASQEVMSSELTLDIASDTQDITIDIISGRIINVASTPTLQTAYDSSTPGKIVLASGKPLTVYLPDGTTVLFNLDDDGNLIIGRVALEFMQFLSGNIFLQAANTKLISLTGQTVRISTTAIALTDGASIAITNTHHTLTTASSRTFTRTYTGDSFKIAITLNATSATFTLPTGDKGIYNGLPSGTNTLVVTDATSGDVIIVAVEKIGSVYFWIGRNAIR